MEKLIEFQRAKLSINRKVIIDDFNFVVYKMKHTAIIGPSASGKSTILKALSRFAQTTVVLHVYQTDFESDYNRLYEKIAVVFNNSPLICETVYSELAFALQNKNIHPKKIDEEIKELAKYFEIEDMLLYDVSLLTNDIKTLVRILSFLITKPMVLALDDVLINLNNKQKKMLINYLEEKEITLLFTTSNIDDAVIADNIYVLNECKIVANGTKNKILTNEKLLTDLGLGIPFYVELSQGLKYYEVLDKVYTTKKELVNALWK